MKFTERRLSGIFGERTLKRGREYFEDQRVMERIKFKDSLWGRVSGSRSEPYKVSVSVDVKGNIETRCSCPVRSMCKHAAALSLCWIKEPDSFADGTEIIKSLEGKSKEELATLIKEVLQSNPGLIPDFEVKMGMASGEPGINLEAVERKITHALCRNLDYYHVGEAVGELRDVQEIADSLARKSKFRDSANLYLLLVEGCVDVLENGADDSDGEIGGLAEECISSFNECMMKVEENSFKDSLLPRVTRLYEREDHDVETQHMFAGVVTRENIKRIEKELQRQLDQYTRKHGGDDFYLRYKKREVKKILIELYKRVENPSEALKLARTEVKDMEDHVLAATVLIQEGEYHEALETIRGGSKLGDVRNGYHLHDAYLQLMEALIHEGRGREIDIDEALGHAVSLIAATAWGLDVEEYRRIRAMFSKLGASKRLISAARERLRETAALVELLLEEEDVHGAAEALEFVREDKGKLAISVAEMARKKGPTDMSIRLTSIALKNGYEFSYSDEKPAKSLIRELLGKASTEELKDIVLDLKVGKEVSMFIAEELATKAPGLARDVIDDIIEICESEKLTSIVKKIAKLNPDEAVKLCNIWISKFVSRSHVYYNDAVRMLKIVKKALLTSGDETDWKKYISAFRAKYGTRKKLIEKIEAAGICGPSHD